MPPKNPIVLAGSAFAMENRGSVCSHLSELGPTSCSDSGRQELRLPTRARARIT